MKFRFLLSAAGLLLLLGCHGTLAAGVERTPTPNQAATATLAALLDENARLATTIAEQATPTPRTVDLGRLAYVLGGDIWVKALPDGQPQRLTSDGRNSQPRWSPTGQWLAFRKEKTVVVEQEVPCDISVPRPERCFASVSSNQEQVWLAQADGTGARALDQGLQLAHYAWSPTEDRIAYVTADAELQVINADDTGLVNLVTRGASGSSGGQIGRLAWSPDGLWIAYEWKVQPPNQPVTYQGIWKVRADGGAPVEMYSSNIPKKGEAMLDEWAPSNRGLLFWQGDVGLTSLTDGVPLYRLLTGTGSAASSAPEPLSRGGMLAYPDFVAPAPAASDPGVLGVVASVAGTGRNTWTNKRIQVGGTPITPADAAAISPAWSPDGTALAYVAMPDEPNLDVGEAVVEVMLLRHLWIINTVGDPEPRQLTAGSYRDEHPQWSADGSTILFARLDAKGQSSLWIVPAAGGAPTEMVPELTPAVDPQGFYGHIEWDGLFDWWSGRGE